MEAESHKFHTKKSLGQHFLNNPRVPARMADAAHVTEGDVVVEVGPGTGALTRALLDRGARVIALEADARAIAVLNETFVDEITAEKLVVSHTDVRACDLTEIGVTPGGYTVVANIPYYLSGKLFRLFLTATAHPSCLVFLVQKEVAHRIARDTKESLLSLSVKAYGDPEYIRTVTRGNFTPPPRIDSAIIRVSNISKRNFTDLDEHFFFSVLKAGFAAKRKQLLGNLARNFDRAVVLHSFSTAAIAPDARAEDLSLETWLTLTRTLSMHRE